jgi:hypothetical protein
MSEHVQATAVVDAPVGNQAVDTPTAPRQQPQVIADPRQIAAVVMARMNLINTKKDELTSWARNYWEAVHPYSAGGAYVNFMMDEGEDRVKATYRDHYPRLAAAKGKYDPTNLFRVNQNIKPAAANV